ncbi:MAG: HEPN domain-containing protein [Pseudomonadota bacterium]
MTKKDLAKLVQYWKNGSKINFDSAKEIGKKTENYVDALFLLHLTTEKILKAYLVQASGKHSPLSHNLLYLAQLSSLRLTRDKTILLSEINEFNLECRYPDDKYTIYKLANKAMFDNYLKKIEKFRKWILSKLK